MSKIHFKGPLTFAKDSKNAKGFISMQIVTKIRILMKNCSITIELQQNPENWSICYNLALKQIFLQFLSLLHMSVDLWNEFLTFLNIFKHFIAWKLPENSHFLLILPRENTNQSISKKAIHFLKNCFAILYHYILEYWKPLSF